MTIPPEMIEATARALIECMGPLFGSPEYLADPVKLARAEKRRADGAKTYALAAIRTLAPMMAEVFAGVIDTHKPDASFDDSGAGALERNALLDNVAAEVRAKGKEMADG